MRITTAGAAGTSDGTARHRVHAERTKIGLTTGLSGNPMLSRSHGETPKMKSKHVRLL